MNSHDQNYDSRGCDYCGDSIDGRPWVVLNRAVFGSGEAWISSEFLNTDDECVWDPEDSTVSGACLCFPGCLTTFIEGKMIQAEIEGSKP